MLYDDSGNGDYIFWKLGIRKQMTLLCSYTFVITCFKWVKLEFSRRVDLIVMPHRLDNWQLQFIIVFLMITTFFYFIYCFFLNRVGHTASIVNFEWTRFIRKWVTRIWKYYSNLLSENNLPEETENHWSSYLTSVLKI